MTGCARYSHIVMAGAIALAAASGCRSDGTPGPHEAPTTEHEAIWAEGVQIPSTLTAGQSKAVKSLLAARATAGAGKVTVDYPLDGSIFPPEITAPTLLWHDTAAASDRWLIDVAFQDGAHIYAWVSGPPPKTRPIDPRCTAPTNEPPTLSEYRASARSWTPDERTWAAIKTRSTNLPAEVTIYGFRDGDPTRLHSTGRVSIQTSTDPVGGMIFYRDVPLMPAAGKEGKIAPLPEKFLGLVAWRLKDVSRPDSKVVLTDMPTCANCHSFSADGTTLAMDVDGPTGDKGAYAIRNIARDMVIRKEDILTWNSFAGPGKTGRTIGFLSRVSPDGRYVISTVNEALYVKNFTDYRFLQVFYPTRGILVWYDKTTDEIRPLPGADDPKYVQCNASWSPDGKWIVFARAPAQDPHPPGRPDPTGPNDPNELPVKFNLYRMPFNDGKGGKAEPIAGASHNGMSNAFAKVSPDGKWIVYVQCRNGLLIRPDSKLVIVPAAGGKARAMNCNTPLMNSWHSFSPNGRWMVFVSKADSPYTQAYLTHIDKNGNDSPPILITGTTAGNRAVNLPEFVKISYASLNSIDIPSLEYWKHFRKGLALSQQDKHAEAIKHFREALATDPESARINGMLADSLFGAGMVEAALPHYNKAIQLDPEDYSTLSDRGNALLHLKRLDEALADFDRAIEMRPDYAIAHANRGSVLGRQGKYEAAMEAFSAAIKHDPRLWWGWLNRAKLRGLMDQDAASQAADLAKALELAPADWSGRLAAERLLQQLQQKSRSR